MMYPKRRTTMGLNKTQSDSVYPVSEMTINYESYDDRMRPRLPKPKRQRTTAMVMAQRDCFLKSSEKRIDY